MTAGQAGKVDELRDECPRAGSSGPGVRVSTRRWRAMSIVVIAAACAAAAALYRRWHLHWGATDAEAHAAMPGDDLVQRAQFVATRAVTINAEPEDVWPFIVQVGFGRAGFYSYDLLDNLGHRSATEVLPEWQAVTVGDIAAPMTRHASSTTSFRVHSFDAPSWLVWAKENSTWSWTLTRTTAQTTRLVTRLKQRYSPDASGAFAAALLEIGDFPMMRKMLEGIRARAELTTVVPLHDVSRPGEARAMRQNRPSISRANPN